MPVKWTPEADQILLLKILETANVSTDAKAISAAWPKTHETPTPSAIIQRIHKIRSMTKSANTPSSPRKKADISPRPIKSDKDAPKAAESPANKRKRTDVKAETNGQTIKSEHQIPEDDLYGDDSPVSTPSKKAKAGPKAQPAESSKSGEWCGLG